MQIDLTKEEIHTICECIRDCDFMDSIDVALLEKFQTLYSIILFEEAEQRQKEAKSYFKGYENVKAGKDATLLNSEVIVHGWSGNVLLGRQDCTN
jgi:hypothetical protein